MTGRHFGAVVRRIERIFVAGTVAGLSEGELLERFATRGDEAAFEAILARHGPMVLGICRQILRDPNDVDDAFQATFLVLVRKAGTLRRRDLLGNWLFGVASRVALRARSVAARRRTIEGPGVAMDSPATGHESAFDRESRAMLHEEVRQLPQKYRVPVLLCYLEGLTHEEAARQLGWPLGTVKGRLARAREMLHKRLTRRGVNLSASALSAAVARQAEASVPAALVQSTIKAAVAVAAGRVLAAGVVAANVAALMKEGSNAMLLNNLKVAVTVLVAGVLTTGAAVLAFQNSSGSRSTATTRITPQATPKAPARAVESVVARSGREAIAVLAPQVAARDKTFATRALLAKLEENISMSFANETAIEDVLRYIKSATQGPNDIGIRIYVDPLALKELKIDPTTATITMDLEGIPLRTSLRLALKQLNLAYCVKEGMVIISSVEGILQELKEAEAAEEVAEELPPPPPAPEAKRAAPETAAPVPVPAAGNYPQASPETDVGLLKSRALNKRLDEPINLSFPKETSLEDVFVYLKKAARAPDGDGLPIYVDPNVRENFEKLVQIDLQGVPLRTTLTLLLNQAQLAWSVQDGLLIISAKAKIESIFQIASHLTLAFPRVPGPPAMPPTVRNPKLLTKFDAPITLSFREPTPLQDIIKAIRVATKEPDGSEVPIYFGTSVYVFDQKSNSNADTKIGALLAQIDLKAIPLRTCLALLLAQPEIYGRTPQFQQS